MATVAVNASPFSCRWIQEGSEMRMSNWTYAVCRRRSDPRVVSEWECSRCPFWEGEEDASRHEGCFGDPGARTPWT
jgi:hypothetical protein